MASRQEDDISDGTPSAASQPRRKRTTWMQHTPSLSLGRMPTVNYRKHPGVEQAVVEKSAPLKRNLSGWGGRKCADMLEDLGGFQLSNLVPIISWFPRAVRSPTVLRDVLGDVACGVTVAAIVVPQGMAYAMLAQLPPVHGLYTAMLPQLGYLVFGTCRHLSVGPFALISMFTAQGVLQVVPDPHKHPEDAVAAAGFIALLAGVALLLMGFLRLGFLATLMSDSVLSGYTTAVSLIIPLSQMKYALQVQASTGRSFFSECFNLVEQAIKDGVNLYSLAFFFIAALAIYALQVVNRSPRLKAFPLPAELIVVIAAVLACRGFGLDAADGANVAVIGQIPSGLPPVGAPGFLDGQFNARELVSPSLMVALMTYVTSMSVSRTFGRRFDYEVDGNQELIALGVSSLLSSVSFGFPASASFSRTAVAASAGAKTPLHGLWTTAVVCGVLLFMSPLLEALPKAVLAAIVAMAFKSLLLGGIAELRLTWGVSLSDFAMWNIAFWSTLLTSVDEGIAIAVSANIVYLLWCTTRPTFAVLGRLEDNDRLYGDRRVFSKASAVDGVLIFRFDAPLNFANCDVFVSRLRRELRAADEARVASGGAELGACGAWRGAGSPGAGSAAESTSRPAQAQRVTAVILDLSPVSHIDVTAVRALTRLRTGLAERRTRLVLAHCEYRCFQKLSDMGFFDDSGAGAWSAWCFRELHDAVRFGERRLPMPEPEPEDLESGKSSAPGESPGSSTTVVLEI